jgi:hypothetical protein
MNRPDGTLMVFGNNSREALDANAVGMTDTSK